MALNGGVTHAGGNCSAISSTTIATGRVAAERMPDHQEAKRTTRRLIQPLMTDNESEFGERNCSQHIDHEVSTPAQHDAFLASGVWRETCMRQIEFSADRLSILVQPDA